LKHFKGFLDQKTSAEEVNIKVNSKPLREIVYVKKWMKTSHALIFKLSNKVM
jgi:hypothetical protein